MMKGRVVGVFLGILACAKGPGVDEAREPTERVDLRPVRLAETMEHVVLMLETSSEMREWAPGRQSEIAQTVLAVLPPSTRVTILAVDWLARAVAEGVTMDEAKAILQRWDDIPLAGALHPRRVLAMASDIGERMQARLLIFVGRGKGAFSAASTAATN
jgi:hypothetical protein